MHLNLVIALLLFFWHHLSRHTAAFIYPPQNKQNFSKLFVSSASACKGFRNHNHDHYKILCVFILTDGIFEINILYNMGLYYTCVLCWNLYPNPYANIFHDWDISYSLKKAISLQSFLINAIDIYCLKYIYIKKVESLN